MKNSWKIWTLVIVGVCFCLSFWLYPNKNTMHYSTTSQLKVVGKSVEDNELWIRGFNPQEDQKKDIRMSIKDRSIWNLIRENEIYVITYTYKEGQEPVFVEIAPIK